MGYDYRITRKRELGESGPDIDVNEWLAAAVRLRVLAGPEDEPGWETKNPDTIAGRTLCVRGSTSNPGAYGKQGACKFVYYVLEVVGV